MPEFILDTSGTVRLPDDVYDYARRARFGSSLTWEWDDFDPFTQGFIEALFKAEVNEFGAFGSDSPYARDTGFSDFAGETVAAILKDCAAASTPNTRHASDGRRFWERRQAGTAGSDFPPLTAYLGDDGKVYLREAGQ